MSLVFPNPESALLQNSFFSIIFFICDLMQLERFRQHLYIDIYIIAFLKKKAVILI